MSTVITPAVRVHVSPSSLTPEQIVGYVRELREAAFAAVCDSISNGPLPMPESMVRLNESLSPVIAVLHRLEADAAELAEREAAEMRWADYDAEAKAEELSRPYMPD